MDKEMCYASVITIRNQLWHHLKVAFHIQRLATSEVFGEIEENFSSSDLAPVESLCLDEEELGIGDKAIITFWVSSVMFYNVT